MAETKLVRAIEQGFYKAGLVAPGTVFRVPTDFKAKWAVDADAPEAPKVVDKTKLPDEPTTLSEMGRRGNKRAPIGLQPAAPLTTD